MRILKTWDFMIGHLSFPEGATDTGDFACISARSALFGSKISQFATPRF